MIGRGTLTQFWRYGAVGLASNVFVFLLYVLLTHWGMPSKLAMTLLYAAAVAQTFVFNKRWSFRSGGHAGKEFRRYLSAYAAGYVLQICGLFLLVDGLGWPHQFAQGILILSVAIFLFLLQKFWVFPKSQARSDAPLPTA